MNKLVSSTNNTIGCIAKALEIIGDQWTAFIVRELVSGPKCYSELELSISGINPRTLSARLEKLHKFKIIYKDLYCAHPPRHKYKLTQKGQELKKVIREMAEWGEKYN